MKHLAWDYEEFGCFYHIYGVSDSGESFMTDGLNDVSINLDVHQTKETDRLISIIVESMEKLININMEFREGI